MIIRSEAPHEIVPNYSCFDFSTHLKQMSLSQILARYLDAGTPHKPLEIEFLVD